VPQFEDAPLTDVNQRGFEGDAPLHVASQWGALEDVEVLAAAGANVNQAGDLGNTPLHNAAFWGRLDVVKKLLALGANPLATNEHNKTPQKWARSGGLNRCRGAASTVRTRERLRPGSEGGNAPGI